MSKQRHLSRLASPRTWPVSRKNTKWIAKPLPGPRSKQESLPLIVLLREVLKIVENQRELKYLINTKQVLINGKLHRNTKMPVGLFDVVSLPKIKKNYRVILTERGKINAIEIPEKEANNLVVQVIGRTVLKGGKFQLNLANGWNIITKGKEKVGDTVLIDINSRKIVETFSYSKGAQIYFVRGKRAGTSAIFQDMKEIGLLKREKIAIMIKDKETIEGSMRNIIVVGGSKPAIKLR